MSQPIQGKILLAAPHLTDPTFQRAVVLMCEHGPAGSFGLVLNRPGSLTLAEAFPDLVGPTDEAIMRQGGPVQPEAVFILHDAEVLGGREVLPGLWLGAEIEVLENLMEGLRTGLIDGRFRLFAGYAGWGEGQLEAELGRNDWIVIPAESGSCFEIEGPEAWGEILESMGGNYALLARAPLDPTLN